MSFRLALVTTPPSARSAIGDYTRHLVPRLRERCDVAVFVEPGRESEPYEGEPARSSETLLPRDFDQVLYQVGNDPLHAFMLPLVRVLGGTVALHDWVLFDLALAAHPELAVAGWAGTVRAWREGGLGQARLVRKHAQDGLASRRFELSLHRSIARFGDAFVVHSEFVRQKLRDDRNAPTPIAVIPHGADALWRTDDRRLAREPLGLPREWREAFVLTSFGSVRAHKRIDVVLDALALARKSRDVRLVLIGGVDASEYDVESAIRARGLAPFVHLAGHVPEERGREFAHAGDLAVQLRGPSTGGTSGGVYQSLSVGRGVIASALDEQRELPDECVYKLAPGADEAARLAAKIVALADAPSLRDAMEEAARDYVNASCRWELVAARYAEALMAFPPPRTARKSLFALRVRRGVRERNAGTAER